MIRKIKVFPPEECLFTPSLLPAQWRRKHRGQRWNSVALEWHFSFSSLWQSQLRFSYASHSAVVCCALQFLRPLNKYRLHFCCEKSLLGKATSALKNNSYLLVVSLISTNSYLWVSVWYFHTTSVYWANVTSLFTLSTQSFLASILPSGPLLTCDRPRHYRGSSILCSCWSHFRFNWNLIYLVDNPNENYTTLS